MNFKFLKRILCCGLLGIFTCSCQLDNRNGREWIENRCSDVEKVYPTNNLEELLLKFPKGYSISQYYETGQSSYELNIEYSDEKELSGTVKFFDSRNQEGDIDIFYEDGIFLLNEEYENRTLIKKGFLFQFLTINKNVLSKLKMIRSNRDEMTGSYLISYEINDKEINEYFDKKSNEIAVLEITGTANSDKKYFYSISVQYGEETNYIEIVQTLK